MFGDESVAGLPLFESFDHLNTLPGSPRFFDSDGTFAEADDDVHPKVEPLSPSPVHDGSFFFDPHLPPLDTSEASRIFLCIRYSAAWFVFNRSTHAQRANRDHPYAWGRGSGTGNGGRHSQRAVYAFAVAVEFGLARYVQLESAIASVCLL
jgi:hypothetical protein